MGAHAERGGTFAQVMKAYYSTPVPGPGEELEFMPDAELQPVHYARPAIFDLTQRFVRRSAIAAAEAEAAAGLRTWTVACLCRSLSLNNILTFLTGVRPLLKLWPVYRMQPDLLVVPPYCALCAGQCNNALLVMTSLPFDITESLQQELPVTGPYFAQGSTCSATLLCNETL